MRVELVAIHAALDRFEDHHWLGIFSYTLSSMPIIRLYYNNPGLIASSHYHYHMFLLKRISEFLESRRE
jgi:hypothetical protein